MTIILSTSTTSKMNSIVDDVLILIFKHLYCHRHAEKVCKRWRRLISKNISILSMYVPIFFDPEIDNIRLCTTFERIAHIYPVLITSEEGKKLDSIPFNDHTRSMQNKSFINKNKNLRRILERWDIELIGFDTFEEVLEEFRIIQPQTPEEIDEYLPDDLRSLLVLERFCLDGYGYDKLIVQINIKLRSSEYNQEEVSNIYESVLHDSHHNDMIDYLDLELTEPIEFKLIW